MKIDFEFTHPVHGLYSDCLNLPDDHGYTDDELNAMKQQRFDGWVNYLENPPIEDAIVEEQPVIEE